MKVKLILSIKSKDEVMKEFANNLASARKGNIIPPHNEISFQDVCVLRKFITEK